MIAEILRTVITSAGCALFLVLAGGAYWLAYDTYKEFRDEGPIHLIAAVIIAMCASLLILVVLWMIAHDMGW